MAIGQARVGPIRTIADAQKALEDLAQTVNQLVNQSLTTLDKPSTSHRQIPVMQTDGTVQLWQLIAGSGTTLTFNAGAKTITVTAP